MRCPNLPWERGLARTAPHHRPKGVDAGGHALRVSITAPPRFGDDWQYYQFHRLPGPPPSPCELWANHLTGARVFSCPHLMVRIPCSGVGLGSRATVVWACWTYLHAPS